MQSGCEILEYESYINWLKSSILDSVPKAIRNDYGNNFKDMFKEYRRNHSEAYNQALLDYKYCKEEDSVWVNSQLKEFPGCDKTVLRFIDRILNMTGKDNINIIETLFSSGMCYYFAKMLQDAFEGDIVWHKGFGHILWVKKNIAYDAHGVFTDYGDNDLIPINDLLIGEIEMFRPRY